MTREARDYTGKLCPMPKPDPSYSMRESWMNGIVELWACRSDFAVVYGLQMKSGLSWGQASRELGESLMHALQCEGKLD